MHFVASPDTTSEGERGESSGAPGELPFYVLNHTDIHKSVRGSCYYVTSGGSWGVFEVTGNWPNFACH